LRNLEEEHQAPLIESALKKSEVDAATYAGIVINFGFQALILGHQKARDFIPRLLEILIKFKEHVAQDFKAKIKNVPAWMFLKWINQLISLINQPENEFIKEKVVEIVRKYPQAFFYPFKVLESNIEFGIDN
jgi:hypothetical protein